MLHKYGCWLRNAHFSRIYTCRITKGTMLHIPIFPVRPINSLCKRGKQLL